MSYSSEVRVVNSRPAAGPVPLAGGTRSADIAAISETGAEFSAGERIKFNAILTALRAMKILV